MPRALALLLTVVSPFIGAVAQEAGQPTVLLTLNGGLTTGQSLWRVNQPLCVWQTVIGGYQCEQGPSGTVNDTLALSRRLGSGLSVDVGIAKFLTPHVGARLDFSYAEESIQDHCDAPGGFQADTDQKNLQTCDHFTADNASLSLVGIAVSGLLRPFPGRPFSPYLRVGAGLVIPTGETLAASGEFFANGRPLDRQMIVDSSGQGLRPYGILAVGLQTGRGSASRFQLEVSDAIITVDRIAGAADIGGHAPHIRSYTHNLSATMGIVLVLSGKHGRRY